MTRLEPDRAVDWRFTDGPREWIGTDATFQLTQDGDTGADHEPLGRRILLEHLQPRPPAGKRPPRRRMIGWSAQQVMLLSVAMSPRS